MKAASLAILCLAVGCGGSSPAVTELDAAEQQGLCERFLADVCPPGSTADFCTEPCLDTCAVAVTSGAVASECGLSEEGEPITEDLVEACAAGYPDDFTDCLRGGGCMFDALEANCI